ncbi:AAA family ATPase [Chloroflexota bacterium]
MGKTGYDLPPMRFEDFKTMVSNLPPSEDIIEEILPKNEVALICGDPWQGKSLELQTLLWCFSSGESYHGLKVEKCEALYITWEGSTKGIVKRLEYISYGLKAIGVDKGIEPQVKLVSGPTPLNTTAGYDAFCSILDGANKNGKVKVVLIDSAPYTMSRNTGSSEVVNYWWSKLQSIISQYDITPIFSWEFVKEIIFDARLKEQTFSLWRLKTASTTAYKANTVLAIGELKDLVQRKWTSLGTKLAVLKSKDSSRFEPLSVKLTPIMTFTGQHWVNDDIKDIWVATND